MGSETINVKVTSGNDSCSCCIGAGCLIVLALILVALACAPIFFI
jgi:hypothetical protein